MPYNTVRLLRRRRLYSNFLQFSDNFGLAALVRLAVEGGRARGAPGSMEVSAAPPSIRRASSDGAVGATQDVVLLSGRVVLSICVTDNILALQFRVTTLLFTGHRPK